MNVEEFIEELDGVNEIVDTWHDIVDKLKLPAFHRGQIHGAISTIIDMLDEIREDLDDHN